MNKKETFIEETLNSLEGIGKAKANPYLFQKVMNRFENERQWVGTATFRWAFAMLMLLVCLNVFSILYKTPKNTTQNGYKVFQTEYFSYINNF